jgi:hypothetical protein
MPHLLIHTLLLGTQFRGYRSRVKENFTQAESSDDAIFGELAGPDLDGRNNLLEYAFAGSWLNSPTRRVLTTKTSKVVN